MAITDEQFNAWLESPSALRCTLVDMSVRISSTETTKYISTVPYVMADASIAYDPILKNSVKYTEQLSTKGAGLSVGDLELYNPSGELDSWLDYVWVNRTIVAYLGDVRWPKSDFRVIFNGIISDIDSRGRNSVNIQITDKMQRLNTPITEEKLGGSTANKDALLPLVLGEVHNISPLSTNPAILEFQVHNGPIERIIEVRDNGVIIPTTDHLTTGKFETVAPIIGTITCSIQGAKPSTYSNKIADLVQLIVKNYGKASQRFTDSDIDLTNFSTFNTNNPQPVGYYVTSRENVLNVCQSLADSVGAQLVMSRLGKLRLIKISLPITSTFSIGESDMVLNSLQISETIPVISSVKLGYCKNWTVQTDLLTGIPQEHKDLYALDWLNSLQTDSTVASIYKLDSEPVQIDTCLLTTSDSDAEATRRLNMNKVPRTVYRFSGTSRLMQLELGQGVTLNNWRFGMNAGKIGQVISLTPDWESARVEVEVMI